MILRLTPMGLLWKGRRIPCTIGRTGLTQDKREGDGATPDAEMRIVGMYYRPDRIRQPQPWAEPIGPQDLWSDDTRDGAYNSLVKAPYAFSHEVMRRPDPLYDLVMVTDWNFPHAQAGKGSAIFLHQWRRLCAPTAGCVAMSRENLHRLASEVEIGTKLIISGVRQRG